MTSHRSADRRIRAEKRLHELKSDKRWQRQRTWLQVPWGQALAGPERALALHSGCPGAVTHGPWSVAIGYVSLHMLPTQPPCCTCD